MIDTVKRVTELAAAQNMSLAQLTRESGLADATIRRARNRGGQLTVETIARICDALGITLKDFFDCESA